MPFLQAKAGRKRRDLQRHIFYTEPPTPVAGETVKLFYNPDTTALRGRPEIWIRGSFNRSRHPEKFGPLRMEPLVRGGNGFNVVELQVGFQIVLLPSLEAVPYFI